jgi:hypothetical protein
LSCQTHKYWGKVTFFWNSWSMFLEIFDGWQWTEIWQFKLKYAQIWWKLDVMSCINRIKWGQHQKFATYIKIGEVWQLFHFVWKLDRNSNRNSKLWTMLLGIGGWNFGGELEMNQIASFWHKLFDSWHWKHPMNSK